MFILSPFIYHPCPPLPDPHDCPMLSDTLPSRDQLAMLSEGAPWSGANTHPPSVLQPLTHRHNHINLSAAVSGAAPPLTTPRDPAPNSVELGDLWGLDAPLRKGLLP